MSLELILLMLVPLVLFVVVEWKWGVKAGAITAVALSIALVIYWYFRFDTIDETLIIEAGLIAVLGLITVRMRDPRYIKFQPVVLAAILAVYLAYFQILGTPVLNRLMPTMVKLMPEAEWLLHDARAQQCLGGTSFWFIWVFVVHGILVGFVALRSNSFRWLMARLAIYPLALVPAIYLPLCIKN